MGDADVMRDERAQKHLKLPAVPELWCFSAMFDSLNITSLLCLLTNTHFNVHLMLEAWPFARQSKRSG